MTFDALEKALIEREQEILRRDMLRWIRREGPVTHKSGGMGVYRGGLVARGYGSPRQSWGQGKAVTLKASRWEWGRRRIATEVANRLRGL